MKNRIILALSLLLICACSKMKPNPIVGTWALVDYTYVNIRTGKMVSGQTDVKTWTFLESGSAYINGSTPIIYTINGKFLTHSYVNKELEIVYEIEELSSTTLKVYWYRVPGKYQDGMDNWYTFTKMK